LNRALFQAYTFQQVGYVKRRTIIRILIIAVIGLALWRLFVMRGVKLRANGKVVATVKIPAPLRWGDEEYAVYAGETKLFSIWADFFDCPLCFLAAVVQLRLRVAVHFWVANFDSEVPALNRRERGANPRRPTFSPANSLLQQCYGRFKEEEARLKNN
jgi:hypothetical protein